MSTPPLPPGYPPPLFGASTSKPEPAGADVRIRLANNHYRAIAPTARRSGLREFINGTIVLEEKQKNGLDETIWVKIGEVPKPRADGPAEEKAIYSFLANGAEDAE